MGVVNFSIPDDVKEAFDEAFGHENKSAVVANLMRQAVEERRRRERRERAIEALLRVRRRARPVGKQQVRRARDVGRP